MHKEELYTLPRKEDASKQIVERGDAITDVADRLGACPHNSISLKGSTQPKSRYSNLYADFQLRNNLR
ncbi:hypothetical protein R50076_04610 [Gilvimarinus japonicus]